ncbi:MAG TPA: hypothetical protein VIY49_30295 [Bryobacteraceae bacterium]
MFARLLVAACCLLNTALCFDRSEPVGPPKREVLVYLKTSADQPAPPLEEMKREAGAIMESAGYSLSWRNLPNPGGAVDAMVVVVELRGICRAPRLGEPLDPLLQPASLASTAIVDGEVLPFSWVECETLSRMLAPALSKYGVPQDYLYGRAMGRLVAHELFHILTMSADHDDGGVAKSSFSVRDILADRFTFEATALTKLETAAPDEDSTGGGEVLEEAGR